MARDREPQTGATTANTDAIHLVEPLEDPGLIRRRDAHAVILDGQADLVATRRHGHPDLRSRRVLVGSRRLGPGPIGTSGGVLGTAELQRVVDEVHDDLAEARLVATHEWQTLGTVDHEAEALSIGEQAQALDGVLGDGAEIDAVEEDER